MNTKILEYVITLAEEKNQSRAAEKLLISQSALSQQIHKLENDIGVKLFRRENGKLALTDEGKIYVNGAEAALKIYYNAINDIRKIRTKKRKQITIVYNKTMLPLFPTIISEYIESHKDIYISTVYGNASIAKEYLYNGMADIAVTATINLSNTLFEYIPLFSDELELVLPASHPCIELFQKSGVDFDILRDEYFILNESDSFIAICVEDFLSSIQFIPKSFCEISDLSTALNMVNNKRGIAFLPASLEKNDESIAFSLDPPIKYHVVLAYRKNLILNQPIRDLIMLMLKKYDFTSTTP